MLLTGGRLLSSRYLVVFLVVAFLLATSFLPIPEAAQLHRASDFAQQPGLDFPYSYQQPAVPPDIGAQGVQGPTVPLDQIGALGHIGSTGHIGPVNTTNPYAFSGKASTLEFHVLNGTVSGSGASNKAVVNLVNITTGQNINGLTNANGYLNLTATEGWYYLTIAPAVYGTRINYEQQVKIDSANQLLTRYLLPDGGSTVAVNNRGTAGTIWFTEQTNAGVISQLSVALLNESASGAILASGNSMNNGSIEFTNVNTAYGYAFSIDGYSNPSTQVRYYLTNFTTSTYTFSGVNLVVHDASMAGFSSSTGTLSGVSLPTGNARWDLTSPTMVTGGRTYISSPITFSPSATLTFTNALVIFNDTLPSEFSPAAIKFHNSTVYFIAEGTQLFNSVRSTSSVEADHTLFFGVGDTALPVSSTGIIVGFVNASASLFYYMNSNYRGAVYGTFFNDVVLNSTQFQLATGNGSSSTGNPAGSFYFGPRTTMSYLSFVNSIPSGGDIHVGYTTFSHVDMRNSTVEFATWSLNATYFNFNTTLRNGPNFLNAHWLNMSHSNIRQELPQNISYINYINSLPSNNFGNPPGAGPYTGLQLFSGAAGVSAMSIMNITYTHLSWGFPMPNVDLTFGSFGGFLQFYNDWFDYNLTTAQMAIAIGSFSNNVGGVQPSPGETIPFESNRIVLDFHGPVAINYTYMNFAMNAFMRPYSSANPSGPNRGYTSYFEHDYFPGKQFAQDDYGYFRLFVEASPQQSFAFSNDTFGYVFFNWTNDQPGNNQEGFASLWMESDTNQVFNPPGYINITHDTFEGPSFGAGSNGMAGVVQFAKYDIVGVVAYCKFMNSPKYIVWANPSDANSYLNWYLPPHQDNILATASDVTIHDNYFLNLTNLTMPFGSDQSYQQGGFGGNTTEYNNHFYYYPLPGMTYINSSWGFSNVGYYGSPTPTFKDGNVNGYNGSHLAYEIPVGQQATLTVQKGGDYVYNSSINQLPPSPYVVNDRGWTSGQPSQWSWIIEPDFVWNGSAYVAQYQGMGGPQPNLTYNGHSYQWSFEQNRTLISASSSSASPIPMSWFLPNGQHLSGTANLYLYNYSSGSNQLLGKSRLGYGGASISYTYRPWVDGTTALFFVNTTTSGATIPPPAQYTVTFGETGLPQGTNWSVMLNSNIRYSTGTSISFTEQNGTYSYEIASVASWMPSIPAGSLVVNGSSTTIYTTFARSTFDVRFAENGSSGLLWAVKLGNSSINSSSGSIVFNEPNGTYSYTITPPANYNATSYGGTLRVSGSSVTVNITFEAPNSSSPPGTPPSTHNGSGQSSPVLFRIGGFAVTYFDVYISAAVVLVAATALFAVWYVRQRK